MFEGEEDGAITEEELACILRTALGVAELRVSRLFSAIDVENSGKLTFGEELKSTSIYLSIYILKCRSADKSLLFLIYCCFFNKTYMIIIH